jgi:hypothetical protein
VFIDGLDNALESYFEEAASESGEDDKDEYDAISDEKDIKELLKELPDELVMALNDFFKDLEKD